MRSQALQRPMPGFSDNIIPRVEPFRHQLVTKFGLDYFMWSGPTPMINISKPELVREALTRMLQLQKPKLNHFVDKLFPGLINYEGDKWVQHRKMLNPAFHVEKLKLMLPAFYDSCSEMICNWEKLVAEAGSGEIDVWPYLTNLSADVISRAAFGSRYKEGAKIFELLKEQTALAAQLLESVKIPGFRYIPTPRHRRFREVDNQIRTLLTGIVNKRKQEITAGEATKADLLGLLLESSFREIKNAAGNRKSGQLGGMSLQEVIEECKLFYFAGQETTSLLLVWTLILLSKYQDWQSRAREEVLNTFGNGAPHFEGLNHLKTVTMILYEVLRMYPPATQLNRRIPKDTRLGELSLPANSLITIPILFLNRDKSFWGEDADEFKPERFSEGVTKATRGNNTFFPFGWGPRICIGEKFAMTEAKMVLSMILQRFSFEISLAYAHAPMTVISLKPQHGAQIIFRKL